MESSVLYDPPPQVIFLDFGNSGLDFALQVWTDKYDCRDGLISSLHFIIEYNFRQYNIKIPFPQQDFGLNNLELANKIEKSSIDLRKQNASFTSDNPRNPLQTLSIRHLLKTVSYFENLTDLELRKLIEVGYRKHLNTSELLFRESEPGDAFYIVLSGQVEVFVEKINKHLTFLEAGHFLGELSLLLGIPRTATVRASEDTLLFCINKIGFERLLKDHPHIQQIIIKEFEKHQEELAQRQQQLRELGLIDSEEDDSNPLLWMQKRLRKIFNL